MPVQVNESEMWILPFLPSPTFPIIRPDDDDDREREGEREIPNFRHSRKTGDRRKGLRKGGRREKFFGYLLFLPG